MRRPMFIDERLYAPATERNREAIALCLASHVPMHGTVLEVASGTGEHACFLASRFTDVTWQPSDPDPDLRRSINAWRQAAAANNVLAPLDLDARADVWPIEHADVMVNINMIHIAPFAACDGLLRGAARLLPAGGLLYLYGPFRVDGVPTAPSNESFDASLRSQNNTWGLRRLEEVVQLAATYGLALQRTVEMPANNLSVIFASSQAG